MNSPKVKSRSTSCFFGFHLYPCRPSSFVSEAGPPGFPALQGLFSICSRRCVTASVRLMPVSRPLDWRGAGGGVAGFLPPRVSRTRHRAGSLTVKRANGRRVPELLQSTFPPSGRPQPPALVVCMQNEALCTWVAKFSSLPGDWQRAQPRPAQLPTSPRHLFATA